MSPSDALAPLVIDDLESLGVDVAVLAWRAGGHPTSSVLMALDGSSAEVVVLVVAGTHPDVDRIRRVVEALEDADAAAMGGPVTDAVKRVDGDRVVEGIDRSTLEVARLPEAIRLDVLRSALAEWDADVVVRAIDPVAAAGFRVSLSIREALEN